MPDRESRYRSPALLILATTIMMCLPSTAHAQDAPADDILVEGISEVDGNKARIQARQITPRPAASSDTRPRFQRPICAGVWGLQRANAQLVIDRIHDNARKAEVPVNDDPQCKANVWAIIVDDPATSFEKLRDDNNWMVRLLTRTERNRVERQQGPARAWNLQVTRNRDGFPVATGFEAAALGQLSKVLNGGHIVPARTDKMSRLFVPVRRDIEFSVVMIRRAALADVDALTLADYVSMRALAYTEEPEKPVTYDTILNAFKQGSRADRITAFDRAYLESLYRSDAHRPARMSMPSFVKVMEAEIENGNL